jgi:hypothetical protein
MILMMFGRLDDMIEKTTNSFGKERMLRRGDASVRMLENRVLNRILNPEKAESIEILLRTSTVKTEDVCAALLDGKNLSLIFSIQDIQLTIHAWINYVRTCVFVTIFLPYEKILPSGNKKASFAL